VLQNAETSTGTPIANIKLAAVIKLGHNEGVDECSGGIWSKQMNNSVELVQLIVRITVEVAHVKSKGELLVQRNSKVT